MGSNPSSPALKVLYLRYFFYFVLHFMLHSKKNSIIMQIVCEIRKIHIKFVELKVLYSA
nr:MAG TPA: hypothetical protein [Bacteriophage sp.]